MLETVNLQKHLPTADGQLQILKGIDLKIKAGETVAIVGESGSGKSTLLGILAGLDSASSGQVMLDGVELGALSEDERALLRARLVGFVFQSFQLLPSLTALENVLLPLELAGVEEATERATQHLQSVGLAHRLSHYPRQLSGGEQQRVAIARAFAAQPKILFADEPTGNLDAATGEQICQLLFALNEQHSTTLVMVTHEERLAGRCQRRLILKDGVLSESAA